MFVMSSNTMPLKDGESALARFKEATARSRQRASRHPLAVAR